MRVTGLGSGNIWRYMGAANTSRAYRNALTQSSGRTSRANQTKQNTAVSKQTSYLEATKKAANGVREHAQKLSESGKNSLFAKAEETGNTKDIVKEAEAFVEDYNNMVSGMNRAGGTTNNIYRSKLSYDLISEREELKNVGITANRDGTLSVNKQTMKDADVEDLKKAFAGTSSFAGRASAKSIYIESDAANTITKNTYQALMGGYGSYGGYGNFGSYGSYGGLGSYSGLGGYGFNRYSALLGNYFNSFM